MRWLSQQCESQSSDWSLVTGVSLREQQSIWLGDPPFHCRAFLLPRAIGMGVKHKTTSEMGVPCTTAVLNQAANGCRVGWSARGISSSVGGAGHQHWHLLGLWLHTHPWARAGWSRQSFHLQDKRVKGDKTVKILIFTESVWDNCTLTGWGQN